MDIKDMPIVEVPQGLVDAIRKYLKPVDQAWSDGDYLFGGFRLRTK